MWLRFRGHLAWYIERIGMKIMDFAYWIAPDDDEWKENE